MAISAIKNTSPSAMLGGAGRTQRLRQLLSAAGHDAKLTSPGERRGAAALLVSELSFKPLLAEMRKFDLGKGLLDGGRTEEIFGEQLDERLADTVAQAGSAGLSSQIAKLLDSQPATGEATVSGDGPPVSQWEA